ncbi:hypothetical protein EMA8858_01207 [Emticicia aquatica]|jgi:hypothetical protein|uniref:Uncharacterized protein n=1 Tax=Emticicia aquatica TaxID=1681835 RepID=A0ABN8EQC3_9BACT|nr:hypothetical protein [Emticicia aquatica]CAH0995087.1 hypothetical protein EMA8858_01207 [Emticicia aquatica]
MNLITFTQTEDFSQFVEVWSQFYDYNSPWEPNYNKHIKIGKPFTHNDIIKLFEWENQAGLGRIRAGAIKDKIYPEIDYVNDMKFEESIDINEYNNKFITVPAVSRTFLLHIIKPEVYPLYDLNVHIAYNFIHDIDSKLHPFPVRPEDKIKFYFRKLMPFIESVRGNYSLKKVDEALNSFGQLIKRNPKFKI